MCKRSARRGFSLKRSPLDRGWTGPKSVANTLHRVNL